jgi:hypothetical protein
LSKQFEPEFEPNDLLQMHNRNFVINMVIRGEKSPAFNATTLTLPKPQTDNTGRIIENTRRHYSRSRAEIEEEISAAIRPPENLQKPATARPQMNWPDGIKPIQNNSTNPAGNSTTPTTPVKTEAALDEAPRPKRKRNRKRKPHSYQPQTSNNQSNSQNQNNDSDSLKINH